MTSADNKLMPLKQAIRQFVTPGCHLSIGGFTVNRNPMAAVYEIIRQGINGLHLYAHSNGQGIDELIGGGAVEYLEIAYGGNGRFAPTCIRFRHAVENGLIKVEDYSNFQMSLRFLAGAMGLPFLPTRSSLGTDLINRWGFSETMRKSNHRIPDAKLCVLDNPFGTWNGADKVVLVPAINPDVTIVHVQKADRAGTARIEGLTFADVEQAKAARHVIVTCEQVVDTEQLRQVPEMNQIPFFNVDAVVHQPWGAYPTACFHHYDYDPVYLKRYADCARSQEKYQRYLSEDVRGIGSQQELIDRQASEQLRAIAADPETGYAKGLRRA